jgi:hypothetical protein
MDKQAIGSVVIRNGPRRGERLELHSGRALTIGRSQDNDLIIPDETVSPRHVELVAEKDGVYFRNYGSNDAIVGDKVVHDATFVLLHHDDLITIGSCELIFKLYPQDGTKIKSQTATESNTLEASANEMSASRNHATAMANSMKRRFTSMHAQLRAKLGELNLPFPKTTISKISFGLVLLIGVLCLVAAFQDSGTTPPKEPDPGTVQIDSVKIQGPVPEEELKRARSLFGAAEKLFAERMLHERNLYDSIQKWQSGIDILGKYAERPEKDYFSAVNNLREATTLLEKNFEAWQHGVLISYRQKDYRNARLYSQKILDAIPDLNDWRYRWAKEQEDEIKRRLSRSR